MRLPGYIAVLALCFFAAVFAGETVFAARIDNYAYDLMFRRYPPRPWTPSSVILAIDEATFRSLGGQAKVRQMVTLALERIAAAKPKAVADDVILADAWDEQTDARLESAMGRIPNLVLPCDVVDNQWEDPLPRFRSKAAAIGHVRPDATAGDGVSRRIPLEATAGGRRRWSLSLEAFLVSRGQRTPLESPDDLQVGNTLIPASRADGNRPLLVRFLAGGIPTISLHDVLANPGLADNFTGKVVFLGVTAQSAARDRLKTPFEQIIPGVEIHAQAYETMTQGVFLTPASGYTVLGFCALLAAAAAVTFAISGGWPAYLAAAILLSLAHLTPVWFFRAGIVFPYFMPVAAAWLAAVGAATYRHFVARRQLGHSESEKVRYQQAIHFVTHEMRSPLTAIQGSSEIMGRYNLNEDKRRQMVEMINSESKRLARMIQTFLDIERLTDGRMELKNEPFALRDVVAACMDRAGALAERKHIRLALEDPVTGSIAGDRELMEYAVYNLITNAIKYSPSDTEVFICCQPDGANLRLSIRDHGIGMDAKELSQIFTKFYRTKKAEASGEAGTGIGLSLVRQIVAHHGGRMEVSSTPGKGSCFTMVIPGKSEVSLPVGERER